MTITRTQIAKWIDAEFRQRGPDWDRTPRDWQIASRVVKEPRLSKHLSEVQRSALIWRLGWMFGSTWRPGVSQSVATFAAESIRAMPDFLNHWYGDSTTDSDDLNMFWDLVLNNPSPSGPAVSAAAFEALCYQLDMPNRWIQLSAIHGFNHLKEPRCRPILRRFIESCEDEHLRDYARRAMTFTLM